jgi:hypothetical protein
MRKVFLSLLFVLFSGICSAPSLDFKLALLKITEAWNLLERQYHESELSRFITDLGYRESGNNWQSVNKIGCFGEWQFQESTLWHLGYTGITLHKFIKNPEIFPPELQLAALKNLIQINLSHLSDYEHFIGDSIKGIRITKSGLIAAAHLGGALSVQQYLDSRGRVNKKDVLGTSIYDYLKIFSYYDLE